MVKSLTMTSADLRGMLRVYGPIEFLRVEWNEEHILGSVASLIYAFNGVEQRHYIGIDLERRIILNDFGPDMEKITDQVCKDAFQICLVITEIINNLHPHLR